MTEEVNSSWVPRTPDSSFTTDKRIGSNRDAAIQSLRNKAAPSVQPERKISISQLNKMTNSRYNPELIARRLLVKYKDPVAILEALDKLTGPQGDKRFNEALKNQGFSLDKQAFEQVKLSIRILSRSNEAASRVLSSPRTEKIEPQEESISLKHLAAELVGCLVNRPITRVRLENGNEMTQTSGHVMLNDKGEVSFIKGKTISAETQKREVDVSEIANHAVITFSSQNGQSEVVLSRSSRTDTVGKVHDKSSADILARLQTTNHSGLIKDPNLENVYTYQRTDVTLMDTNWLKAVATTVKTGLQSTKSKVEGKGSTTIENEREFVKNKKQVVSDIYDGIKQTTGKEYIEHRFMLHGRQIIVRERKPLVFNFVFSGQAMKAENIESARMDNIEPTLNLFVKLISKEENKSRLSHYADVMKRTATKEGQNELLGKLRHDLISRQFSDNPEMVLALRCVLVTLTGKDEKDENYDTKDACDAQFLLTYSLSELAGSAFSVECKSGNDRTATAMALVCAQKAYKAKHGMPYSPPSIAAPASPRASYEQGIFKEMFNKFILEFGSPNLIASRGIDEIGKADIKTKKSPPFLKYFNKDQIDKKLNIT